jgi:flagellar motor switch protein FliN
VNSTLVETIDLAEAPASVRNDGDPVVRRDLAMLEHVTVKLEVVVGRATTTVRDLFAYEEGDTVTLDAGLDEPVLLQVDGKTVARGHLVAVGDRFGLRITEVA